MGGKNQTLSSVSGQMFVGGCYFVVPRDPSFKQELRQSGSAELQPGKLSRRLIRRCDCCYSKWGNSSFTSKLQNFRRSGWRRKENGLQGQFWIPGMVAASLSEVTPHSP